ncbi:hypothetical protein LCGC14_0549670 [marine sediment metagenome]|uniref:Uncharacterized protein n=1 Tax=marine sediment metagenome TaxID=412755 RepID=A0A0F9RQB3_9ZZZZ
MTKKEAMRVIESKDEFIEYLMEEYRKLMLKHILFKSSLFDAEIQKARA